VELNGLDDLGILFKRAAARSSSGRTAVRVPQLPRLHRTVTDISRSAAGGRVREIFRQVNMWTDESVSRTILPSAGASALLAACAVEASSLLELGYRREDGVDFIMTLPDPSGNPVRTPSQIRAVLHHMGGDMKRFMEMLDTPDPSCPDLKLVFSAWPLGGRLPDAWRPGEKTVSLHLSVEGSTVPLVISFSDRFFGYGLLCLWDLARSLCEESRNTKMSTASFALFAGQF
jgi:hypothetical protein